MLRAVQSRGWLVGCSLTPSCFRRDTGGGTKSQRGFGERDPILNTILSPLPNSSRRGTPGNVISGLVESEPTQNTALSPSRFRKGSSGELCLRRFGNEGPTILNTTLFAKWHRRGSKENEEREFTRNKTLPPPPPSKKNFS